MKLKKLLSILVVLIAVCVIATIAAAESTEVVVPTTCAVGCENPEWQPYSAVGNLNNLTAGHHHVYLDSDITPKQIQLGKDAPGVTLCLDLNGFNIVTSGRSFIVYEDCVMNIMDSSVEQTGYICGTRGDNNEVGGTISVQPTAELNLYSGSLRFTWDDEGTQSLQSAGIVWVQAGGTMNMYGGEVVGADMTQDSAFEYGGAICVSSKKAGDVITSGQLNVYGGKITSGTLPEGATAPCVYLGDYALMTISGDAVVDDIYTTVNRLTVDGEFSGEAYLTLRNTTPTDGLKVGSAINEAAITGKLFCVNPDGWNVLVVGEELVLEAYTSITKEEQCPVCNEMVIWKALTKSNYVHMETQPGPHHFFLAEDYSGKQILATDTQICLDLNGYGFTTNGRAFSLDNTTLNVMDSSQDQTGYICGSRGNNNEVGGTISVQPGSTLNLHSGNLRFLWDDTGSQMLRSAGVVWVQAGAVMNMYGGIVEGGDLMLDDNFKFGAAIYVDGEKLEDETIVSGQLNVYGGQILSGVLPEAGAADCVYMEQYAKLTISDDAHIDEVSLYLDSLTLDGTFTGEVWLYIRSELLEEGMDIGDAINTPVIDPNAELFCITPDGWNILVEDDDLVLEAYTPVTREKECVHCGQVVTWKAITRSNFTQMKTQTGPHHFFLNGEDFTAGQIQQRNHSTACIDLNGCNIDVLGRAISTGTGCTLSIMDLSDEADGKVISTTGTNNVGGGVVFMQDSSTFNLYSGTMEHVYQKVPGRGTATGGIVYISNKSTMNVYGGTINGAYIEKTEYTDISVNGAGAAIFIGGSGKLNVEGGVINAYHGEINEGKLGEGCLGECVYVNSSSARVVLSGNAVVEDIYFRYERDQLTVTGEYKGNTHLTYPDTVAMTYRQRMGISDSASYDAGTITVMNASSADRAMYEIIPEGNYLILDYNATAGIITDDDVKLFDTLKEAMQAYEGVGFIRMFKSVEETIGADIANQDVYLDLNGQTVAGAITFAEGKGLYGMDSRTDDFTIEDSGYGKLTATVTGFVVGLPEESDLSPYMYLPITVAEEGMSFHAVNLNISEMVLRPNCAGVYYKCPFAADEMVAPLVESYGVAMSLLVDPNEAELKKSEEDSKCEYSTFENFTAGGMDMDNTGTLLTGVMKTTNANTVNNRNAKAPVRGRAYIKTADGYIFGGVVKRTLREQVEAADTMWDELTDTQRTEFSDMFRTYNTVMRSWDVPNVAAAQKVDDSVLSILGIGNSYTMDSMWMLGQVYAAENPDKQIKLGIAHIDGCNLATHASNIHSDAAVYTYCELDSATGTWTKTNGQTLKQIVSDAAWDVVSLQQSSTLSDDAETYNGDIATIRQFVANTLCYTPDFVWNLTWAWPADPALKENFTADQQTEMYNNILAAVQEKIVTDPAFKLIMPVGIAIQNANQTLADTDLYCDNTHLNAYGRIIAAYVWYCQLEDVDPASLTALKVTTTPAAFSRIHSAEDEVEVVHSEELMNTALAAVRDALLFDLTPEETE